MTTNRTYDYLESMCIVDVAGDLLSSLVPVSDEYDGGHLSIPVGLLSLCQGLKQRTAAYWLTGTAQYTVRRRQIHVGRREGGREGGGKERERGRREGGGREGWRKGGRGEGGRKKGERREEERRRKGRTEGGWGRGKEGKEGEREGKFYIHV